MTKMTYIEGYYFRLRYIEDPTVKHCKPKPEYTFCEGLFSNRIQQT